MQLSCKKCLRTCILFIWISSFIPLAVGARGNNDSIQYRHSLPLAVFWEPSSLISYPYNYCLRFGIEAPIRSHLSLYVIGGSYGSYHYGIKAGAKYYLGDGAALAFNQKGLFRKSLVRYFLAAEYAYKEQGYSIEDSLKGVAPINYRVSKYATTISVLFGQVQTLRSGLYLEWLVGAGIRQKTVHNTLTLQQQGNLYHWHEGYVDAFSNTNADHQIVPHIALSFRIGYWFH